MGVAQSVDRNNLGREMAVRKSGDQGAPQSQGRSRPQGLTEMRKEDMMLFSPGKLCKALLTPTSQDPCCNKCCFAIFCPAVLSFNIARLRGYNMCLACCAGMYGCMGYTTAPGLMGCYCAMTVANPVQYPEAYTFRMKAPELKPVPTNVTDPAEYRQWFSGRYAAVKERFKGLPMDQIGDRVSSAMAMANKVSPETMAKIDEYIKSWLPSLLSDPETKEGVEELGNMLRKPEADIKDAAKKKARRDRMVFLISKICLSIIKAALPGAGPTLALLAFAMEMASEPEQREFIRKHPGRAVARLVLQVVVQMLVPVPGCNDMVEDMLVKVLDSSTDKLLKFLDDKLAADGSFSDATKEAIASLKAALKSKGKEEAKKALYDLVQGVLAMFVQSVLDALQLGNVPVGCPCCGPPTTQVMSGRESLRDETGLFADGLDYTLDEAESKAAEETAGRARAAAKALGVVALINTTLKAKYADPTLVFDGGQAKLLPDTKKKLDTAALILMNTPEGIVVNVEGRSPSDAGLAEQRAKVTYEYLTAKDGPGVSSEAFGLSWVADSVYSVEVVFAAGKSKLSVSALNAMGDSATEGSSAAGGPPVGVGVRP